MMLQLPVQSQQIEVLELIGAGSYAKVFLCKYKPTGQELALKAIQRNLHDDANQRAYSTELTALRKIQEMRRRKRSVIPEKECSRRVDEDEDQPQQQQQQQQQQRLNKEDSEKETHLKCIRVGEREKDRVDGIKGHSMMTADNKCQLLPAESRVISYLGHIDSFTFIYNKQYVSLPQYKNIPFEILRLIAMEILLGLKEMHTAGFAHRDIKEENVVLCQGYRVKLIDLSFSGRDSREVCGTRRYLSPEVLRNEYERPASAAVPSLECPSHVQHNQKIDTFAAGVLFFRLFTKQHPFKLASQFDQKYKHVINNALELFWLSVPTLAVQTTLKQQPRRTDSCITAATPEEGERILRRQNQEEGETARGRCVQDSDERKEINEEEDFDEQESFKDLVSKLLAYNVAERLGVDEALQHHFFSHSKAVSATFIQLQDYFINLIRESDIQQ